MMFVVLPASFVSLAIAARIVAPVVSGPHVAEPLRQSILSVVGYYAGYVIVAGTIVSLVHTFLVRRVENIHPTAAILAATLLGVLSLVPQAAFFGPGYWVPNLFAGTAGGSLYGAIVTIPWTRRGMSP